MSATKCVLLEDLRAARYSLRRYAGVAKCAGRLGYHDARSAPVAERPELPEQLYTGTNPPEVERSDPRWPTECACGYAFADSDARQVHAQGLYRLPGGGVVTWEDAPAGSIRNASWWPDKGADGHAWVVKLPDGSDWMTEGKAGNCNCPGDPAHRCWSRSGQVPNLTVNPSIATPGWHGWLRDGLLVPA